MKVARFEFVLIAQTPIAHCAGTIGNHSHPMKRKHRLVTGDTEDTPIITGDTMRHKMREAGALATFDAAGIENDLSESACRLMFNGGMLKGGSAGTVKLDEYRRLVEFVPTLRLFGGCANNHMHEGMLNVEDAVVICDEVAHLIEDWQIDASRQYAVTQIERRLRKWEDAIAAIDADTSVDAEAKTSLRVEACAMRAVCAHSLLKARHFPQLGTYSAFMDEEQRVRMDATSRPEMQRLLNAGAQVEINKRLAANEAADGDIVAKQDAKSTMLPRTVETIAAGTLLAWNVQVKFQTPLDEDVFYVSILSFLARAWVGGKAGSGHGRIGVVAANRFDLQRASRAFEAFDTAALAAPGGSVGALFRAHVAERADQVREYLQRVAA